MEITTRPIIEDETVRILYFLQPAEQPAPVFAQQGPPAGEEGRELPSASERQQKEATDSTMANFTRSIQRKKQRELDQLQFVGGGQPAGQQPVVKGKKVGRNELCPCGSGKKYKRCCGK